MYSLLFEPLRIGQLTLRNRIVMPPMVTAMEVGSDQHHAWYLERARGGVGLIIREATGIRSLADPAFAGKLARTVEAVHEAGAAIAAQLSEPGRTAQGEPIAASADAGARAATEDELLELVELYAAAARNCRAVGFDGVEPHGAHGFFLNRFFSARHNRRDDTFGGTLERRMEFALRIVRAVRAAVGPECLVLYRHTPVAEGYTLDESMAFASALEQAGVDVLDVSPSTSSPDAPPADMAGALRKAVTVPVIAVGGFGIAPERAEQALAEGCADLIAIGRGLIADAYLPRKLSEGHLAEIVRCTECNELCFGNLARGVAIGCKENPESGQEWLRQASAAS